MNGGAGEEDAEAVGWKESDRRWLGDGTAPLREEGMSGVSGQRARPGAGGFPLPEGVSRAAGPLDGDPMALAGLIARSHRSGPQTLSVLCSLDKIRCWSKTRRIFD